MKLFKISQNVNNDYDTYDEAIVCAKDEKEAKSIHPNGNLSYNDKEESWCPKKDVKVEYIGEAKKGLKKGVICASYNAG